MPSREAHTCEGHETDQAGFEKRGTAWADPERGCNLPTRKIAERGPGWNDIHPINTYL